MGGALGGVPVINACNGLFMFIKLLLKKILDKKEKINKSFLN